MVIKVTNEFRTLGQIYFFVLSEQSFAKPMKCDVLKS